MGSPGEGSTAKLAEFMAATRYEDLPPAVIADTKRIIADTLACAIAGSSFDAGKIVVGAAKALGSAPSESTIVSTNTKVSAAAGAFANSYLANLLDADETFFNSTHHACCTIFPALAVCESRESSGRDLITAVATAYDIGARVGLSLPIARVNEKGDVERFRSAGLGWATFAAAAAAGKALRLEREQFAHAFGIAGWVAPISSHPKWDQSHTSHMMKNSPHGFMGLHGVIAARMAQSGFTADTTIFEGEVGYWKLAGSPECRWDVLVGELGKKWWISEASIKPYASNRLTHHAIDVFRRILREQNLQADEIERVHIKTFSRVASPFLSRPAAPETAIAAQFNLPFALAACAFGFDLTPQWQRSEVLTDTRLRAFTRKIEVETDAGVQKLMAEDLRQIMRYPRIPTEVTVMARGMSYSGRTEYAWGDPWSEQTRMTNTQLKQKFLAFTDEILKPENSDAALEALFNLEHIQNVAAELMPLVSSS
ncbi:MAG: MmgE/PrpD family protein [Betaproteobacteria bacterium]|nr:MmgE/PrpD family protein [Betaproteobacteria bacterium]